MKKGISQLVKNFNNCTRNYVWVVDKIKPPNLNTITVGCDQIVNGCRFVKESF